MTIVVAYADSEPGQAALRAAAREALLRREDIVVVPVERGTSCTPDSLEGVLGQIKPQLDAASLGVTTQGSDLHDPADAVIQVAQQVEASVICLGLRRRSPVGKLLLGSTAQRILLDADIPVMAVKADR